MILVVVTAHLFDEFDVKQIGDALDLALLAVLDDGLSLHLGESADVAVRALAAGADPLLMPSDPAATVRASADSSR